MGILDKFEKGVENVTNRAMSRFSDDIEPIEIASKLRETMDKRAASFARDRSVVPNIFRIHLTPPSIERITAWGQDEMVRQIAARHHGGRKWKILYRERDYHGTTIGALAAAGQPVRRGRAD